MHHFIIIKLTVVKYVSKKCTQKKKYIHFPNEKYGDCWISLLHSSSPHWEFGKAAKKNYSPFSIAVQLVCMKRLGLHCRFSELMPRSFRYCSTFDPGRTITHVEVVASFIRPPHLLFSFSHFPTNVSHPIDLPSLVLSNCPGLSNSRVAIKCSHPQLLLLKCWTYKKKKKKMKNPLYICIRRFVINYSVFIVFVESGKREGNKLFADDVVDRLV